MCRLPCHGQQRELWAPRADTHGFRLKRSLNPDTPESLFLCFSATSFSFVQVICTRSGVAGAGALAAPAECDAVFLSWISWAWRRAGQ